MQQFNLVREFGYEDTVKTPYYYMARHRRWLETQQAQQEALEQFFIRVWSITAFLLKKLFWALWWLLAMFVLGITWPTLKLVEKIYDMIADRVR